MLSKPTEIMFETSVTASKVPWKLLKFLHLGQFSEAGHTLRGYECFCSKNNSHLLSDLLIHNLLK